MMPCLSIRQPWAWLIIHGFKDIENRDWATRFRGQVLVHAGKAMTRPYYDNVCSTLHTLGLLPPAMPSHEALRQQCGGIVGSVHITDCVRTHSSPWKEPDSHGFVLAHAKPLPFHPWPGKLGFFNVPEELLSQLQAPTTH